MDSAFGPGTGLVFLPRYLMLRSIPPQSTFCQNTNFTLLIRSSFEKQMCLISNPVILTTICYKLPELWPHLHCWYWYTSARHCSITPQNRPIVRKVTVSYLFRWSGTRGSGRWHDLPKVTQLVWGGAGELTAEQTGRFFISGAQPSSYKIRVVTSQDVEDVAKNWFAKKKDKNVCGPLNRLPVLPKPQKQLPRGHCGRQNSAPRSRQNRHSIPHRWRSPERTLQGHVFFSFHLRISTSAQGSQISN